MSKLTAQEADGQCSLDGQFHAKVKGTKIILQGHGRIFDEYKQKFLDLEKEGRIVITQNGLPQKEDK